MKTLAILFSVFFWCSVYTQINYTMLDLTNVSARLSNEGTIFKNFSNSGPGYEIPKGSGLNTISSAQFWFAGKDVNAYNLHITLGGEPGLGTDVFKGPYSSNNSYNDPAYQTTWGTSTWEICQSDIDQFKLWYDCNHLGLPGVPNVDCSSVETPSNEVLNRLASWPAHGNTALGQSYLIAPFFDLNLDGNYSIEDGDYPIIKGCCAVYMIQNDNKGLHTLSGSQAIGLEIHYMFYQYRTWDYLNDVTFVDVTAINAGYINYSQFAHGLMLDGDIGNKSDDFFGCDSTKNLMYFYNGDNMDENGYLANPPAIGAVSLVNKMSACTPDQSALNASDDWSSINGLQLGGGNWLNPEGYPTKYIYPGNPADSTAWSEVSAGNMPGNRKAIMTTINDDSFNIGDTISESYAILYARTGDNLQNVQKIIELSADVKAFYDTASYVACSSNGTWGVKEIRKNKIDFSISPNPTSGKFVVSTNQNQETAIEITDLSGKVILSVPKTVISSTTIDMTDKPKGVYMVKLLTDKGNSFKKIIMQ